VKKPTYAKSLAFFVVSTLLLWGAAAAVLLRHTTSNTCNQKYRNDKVLRIDGNSINAELATNATQQEKGLGGRSCIGANEGMLFVFKQPGFYPFWMKDMKFPIDIVWISSSHTVVTVKPDVSPSTYPKNFSNSEPAQYVLEVGTGQAQKLDLRNGATVSF
jgi:uncharacterized membrane protein (UPF0127 family)